MRWTLDPIALAAILALLLIGRILRAQTGPLVTSCVVLLILFVSPLCALSSALFSVRAAHHILLTAVAARLLATAMRGTCGRPAAWAAVHALIS